MWTLIAGCLGVGLLALALLIIWPQAGLLARWKASRSLAQRCRREDALKHLLHQEANGRPVSLESLAGAVHLKTDAAAELMEDLEARGLTRLQNGNFQLTPPGRELASHVVRAHRLWESYLADQTGVGEKEWHAQAEQQEHLLTPEETEALAARLGHPRVDPHGDIIPESGEPLPADVSQSLNTAPINTPLVITHLEDEPARVYDQLAALGLGPGVNVSITDRQPHQVKIFAHGTQHTLAPLQAQNVGVEVVREAVRLPAEERYLASLGPGEKAVVLGLSPACRGPERRRLLDLGFVPGTEVKVAMISPLGDPVAYEVRGTTVALRRDQARAIRIAAPVPMAA
ncbi:MAG: FeoA domain-containing protein [Verrucomicrobiae bacterium]|nr:FeoA domain-containing protein [Verrucomicrobiae bacterium]